MSEAPSTPSESILPPPAEPLGWIDTMIKAVTQPNETAYTQIANDPGLSVSRAALWYFLSALLAFFLSLALSFIFNSGFSELLKPSGASSGSAAGFSVGYAVVALCTTPFMAIFSTLEFIVWVAMIQFFARQFGGQGSFKQLFHTSSAFQTPLQLVLTLVISIPCVRTLSLIILFYVFYLQLLAIKSTNRFGWGPTVFANVFPAIVISSIVCCGIITMLSLFGPLTGNTFSNIQP